MKSFFLKSLFVIVLMLGLAAGGIAWYAHRPLGIGAAEVDFTIARGATMREAAGAMAAAGVPVEPRLLYWIARIGGRAARVAGGAAEGAPTGSWRAATSRPRASRHGGSS